MLAYAIKGAQRPSQIITWLDADGDAVNLSGATITGKMRNVDTGATAVIAGDLTVTNGSAGEFMWDYDAADVATAGLFVVQFTAAYLSGATPGRTIISDWEVKGSL